MLLHGPRGQRVSIGDASELYNTSGRDPDNPISVVTAFITHKYDRPGPRRKMFLRSIESQKFRGDHELFYGTNASIESPEKDKYKATQPI